MLKLMASIIGIVLCCSFTFPFTEAQNDTRNVTALQKETSSSISQSVTINFNNDTSSNEDISERELGDVLFVNYSRYRRPRKRTTDVVQVSLGIYIYNINDIIEKSHEMRITCALKVQWKDEFLVWKDSEKFSSIKSLVLDRSELWIPDVALTNSGDMYALMMAAGILASVQKDGQVEFIPISTITSFCEVDLTYFPFDFQSCYLRFESWAYEPHQETFALIENPVNLEKLKPNEQWQVLDAQAVLETYCYTNKNESCYPGVAFTLFFKRKAAYYNVNIIIPSLIIAIVEMVTFSLPTPEVMKVHISFTCLLAYAVFQTTINDFMPRTSEHTPLMSIYIDLQMAFIGAALLGEGVVFICLGQAEHRRFVPRGLREICGLVGSVILVSTTESAESEEDTLDKQEIRDSNQEATSSNASATVNKSKWSPNDTSSFATTSDWIRSNVLDDSLTNDFRMFEEKKQKDEQVAAKRKQQNRRDWLFIADVAERLTLVIYALCISVTPLVIFYILPTQYSQMDTKSEQNN